MGILLIKNGTLSCGRVMISHAPEEEMQARRRLNLKRDDQLAVCVDTGIDEGGGGREVLIESELVHSYWRSQRGEGGRGVVYGGQHVAKGADSACPLQSQLNPIMLREGGK